jgi:hypothetical protein
MHLKKRLVSAGLALAVVGSTVVSGAGGGHPPAAEAAIPTVPPIPTYCPSLQTLAQAPVYNGTDQAGTVLLLRNGCDGKVLARFSTPYGSSNVKMLSLNYQPIGDHLENAFFVSGFLTFPGHIDTPEFPVSRGVQFEAFVQDDRGATEYIGLTPRWTAP